MDDARRVPTISNADKKLLDLFAPDAFPPVEVTVDLVTVRMSSRFEVAEVTIRETNLHSSRMAALGEAIQKAVNQALREVAERNARRLSEVSERPGPPEY
jgi:DNA-binding protein YbaB